MNAPIDPLHALRHRYQAHLASVRTFAPSEQAGREGRREGTVAGRETRRGMRQAAQWAGLCAPAWDEFTQAWVQAPETIMVWSDLHLDHDNIIRYAQRPFGGAFHMNTQLLANAQAHVDPDQWLLFVGDLAMWKDQARIAEWMAQCPGRKALIIGNHDVRGRECPQRLEDWQALGFDAVADVAWLPRAHGLPETWITHYPLPLNVFRGKAINLHGHTHTNAFGAPWANACVEQNDYRPRPILELLNPALR